MDDPKDPLASLNEPGRPIAGQGNRPQEDPPGADVPKHPHPDDNAGDDEHGALLSNAELEKMTRTELDEYAELREVDISDCKNKQDVIDALRKDERKRKRAKA